MNLNKCIYTSEFTCRHVHVYVYMYAVCVLHACQRLHVLYYIIYIYIKMVTLYKAMAHA